MGSKDKVDRATWRGKSLTTRDTARSWGSAVGNDVQDKVRLMTISWHYLSKPALTLVQGMCEVASWLG